MNSFRDNNIQMRFAYLRSPAGGHVVSAAGSLRLSGITLFNYLGHSKSSHPKSVSQMIVKIGYFLFVYCIP